jgi:hypothetical protein
MTKIHHPRLESHLNLENATSLLDTWSNVLEDKFISSCQDCPANKHNNHQGERLTNDTLKTVNKGKNMEIISVENRDSQAQDKYNSSSIHR